jgi:SanA protein
MKFRPSFLTLLILGVVFLASFPLVWRALIDHYYSPRIYDGLTVPKTKVAIVYGAAIYRNSRLSAVLRDRMDTAINLYESGKVEKILLSGDSRPTGYSEPLAMFHYAVQRGVPAEALEIDHGGLRTYDTCYRARREFDVSQATLVTQGFHLPRALYTCDRLGIDAVGVAADQRQYRGERWYEIRETAATLVALWDSIRLQPPAVLGLASPNVVPEIDSSSRIQ